MTKYIGKINVIEFEQEFYQYSESHPEYSLTSYAQILEKNGIKWGHDEMRSADQTALDEQGVLALIMGANRAEHFCDGALLAFFEDGSLTRWLKRLKDIDWQRSERVVAEIVFEDGSFFDGYTTYRFTFNADGADLSQTHSLRDSALPGKKVYTVDEVNDLKERFAAIHTEYWNADYQNPCVCDGEQWSLTVRYANGYTLEYFGSNAYPENWNELIKFFGIDHDNEETDSNDSLGISSS